jgi:hypothetical protein
VVVLLTSDDHISSLSCNGKSNDCMNLHTLNQVIKEQRHKAPFPFDSWSISIWWKLSG